MSKILKRTSFGLLRTNPRLTTNIKLVADSKSKIYLESIDADPLLSKSIYKGYEVSYNGSYSYDLKRFYSQNGSVLPEDIAYTVYEEDASLEIKKRYNNQYDFTYGAGFYPKNSRLYTEEFAIFAPIWLEHDNVPDYFVIFKMDGPVTINPNAGFPGYPNGYTGNLDNAPFINTLIEDPSNFFANYVQKAKIIKTFDLTQQSPLGTYLRNHVEDPGFPESSVYASLEKGNYSYFNGISYRNGGFCSKSKDLYMSYTLVDKTITEADDVITSGFHDSGVVCANIINMEFLFDDPYQEEYKFSRYFGMYMSAVELGKFTIDKDRLYADRDNELTQVPRPKLNNVGNAASVESSIQTNKNGIKVYPHIGPSGPYDGRLLTFAELQNPRFGYVRDRNGNFYSIDNVNNWNSVFTYAPDISAGPTATSYQITDSNYLRIKNTEIDWKNFSGFEAPFDYIPAIATSERGRPATSFKIIATPTSGDEIRIQYTDPLDPRESIYIDDYTIKGDTSLPAGTSNGLIFSVNGTFKDITNAICQSINSIEKFANEYVIFSAIVHNDEIIVFCRVASENWNKLKISFFSDASVFPFDISNQYENVEYVTNYKPSPIALSANVPGYLVQSYFYGGNNQPGSRAIVERDKVYEFRDSKDTIYVKTNNGYETTSGYGLYLDKPIKDDKGKIIGFTDVDKYFVINLENFENNFEFGSSDKIALYKLAKNTCGYMSIYPIKDFHFDFESPDYNRDGDSDLNKLLKFYQGATGPFGEKWTLNWSLLSTDTKNYIESLIGPSAPFNINGGFQRIAGYTDDLEDTIDVVYNEYDRLKENTISQLALSSRVVPFINKWVYDNECVDVRENGYRLNVNGAFGFSNFSPSFDEVSRNTKFFTHEWYYLQKYPPYMSLQERINSFSYFDEDLYFPTIPDPSSPTAIAVYAGLTGATGASANLLSIEEDYFLSYFTRETVNGFDINRDFKYSLFSLGDSVRPAETLFRGAKVEIKDRAEFTHIDYNKESLRYIFNEKYNGYKFSAVLTYGTSGTQLTFIKNDKFKSVTLVIQANLDDITSRYRIGNTLDYERFIDRALLYTLESQLKVTGTIPYNLEPQDKILSGVINKWTDNGPGTNFKVELVQDSNGNLPNLVTELTLGENGNYNNIMVTDYTYNTYIFVNVFDITPSSFRCKSIQGIPSLGTIVPNGNYSYGPGSYFPTAWFPFIAPNTPNYEAPLLSNPTYLGGGYGSFSPITDSISFSTISSGINLGDPEIRYINVTSTGAVEFDTYTIDLIKPDYPISATYLKRKVLEKTASDLQVNDEILGYEITSKPRVELSISSRYRGSYNPKWRDIIKFVDTDDLKNEDLSYNNIQILSQLKDSNGNVYYSDPTFGQIPVLYFNKVNVENPNTVLSNKNVRFASYREVYPLIGEIAIDYDNFFIFKSNWDVEYYKKYNRRNTRLPVIGTREPKEEKSFFGSKVISIPNNVRLETFPTGTLTEQELVEVGSINNTTKNLIQRTRFTTRNITMTIDVSVTKSLQDWLLADGFGEEFYKYINPNYSFGDYGLNDDIKTYIAENIFQRYTVKEIIFWEKNWRVQKGVPNPPQIQTGLTDQEKIANGYVKSKNFRTIQDKTGSLNFKVIYTIPRSARTSIAFTVILEKK